jgi:hypothetical protein
MIFLKKDMILLIQHPFGVRPEMVDFGSGQGRSAFETAGVAGLRRGFQMRENAGMGRKVPFPGGHP